MLTVTGTTNSQDTPETITLLRPPATMLTYIDLDSKPCTTDQPVLLHL